ncbi:hypothetical protein [Pseudalkalibacillus caeni]|uniref:Uncharacterized protein n=1 Tax=Exobacillus caeni TaxID=2574798 RepID=A0A5R9F5I1_9BACL|nr:hypothetical protein [Pseudalkalibacillus caeni]TLS36073.1 hypothetical protein FCL54_16925 [Pseudalkalibacillus caeni]
MIPEKKESAEKRSGEYKNEVKVHNSFQINVNFGDSLNLLALAGGIYFAVEIARKAKERKKRIGEATA